MGNKDPSSQERLRAYAAVSFIVILIILGVPLWWKTTEVYRVSLPYTEIEQLNNIELKLNTTIWISTLDKERGEKLISDLKDIFKISKLFSINFLYENIDKRILASHKTIAEFEEASFQPKIIGHLLFLEVPGLARLSPGQQVLVGAKRTVYFSTETSSIKLAEVLDRWLLGEDSLDITVSSITTPTEITSAKDTAVRRRVPPSSAGGYDVLITLVNPDPSKLNIQWDLSEATEEYLSPLVEALRPVTRLAIRSQQLFLVSLDIQPLPVNGRHGNHWAVPHELLSQVITPLEKKLGAHAVAAQPTINFVVYVPSCTHAPLHVYDREGARVGGEMDAWLSPRWGGIAILNPPVEICTTGESGEFRPSSEKAMAVFALQLRQLIGIADKEHIPSVQMSEIAGNSIREWELDSLIRTRALEQITTARITLQSLSQLLAKIGTIVIGDEVGENVFAATRATQKGLNALNSGALHEAFVQSKEAFRQAEIAFTDPSLLALLYFPDDQKYAVYIPLFLPIMIPVVMSLRHIRKWCSLL